MWRLQQVRWTWSNWTFGVWWGRCGPAYPLHVGLDVGPLEIVWMLEERVE